MKTSDSKCQFIHGVLAGEDLESISRSLKAIAHPVRLRILCFIGAKEVSVKDIVANVGTSQSNISQHLSVMKSKEIVDSKKVANRVFYHVKNTTILKVMGLKIQRKIVS
ncbi:MAG: winged helix-turn-helix transcriptional regulator [Cocleimonas sp.]|nr:winged helix-turn-helix transcriptional regulator [Cocleimonas sp.]